MLSTLIAGKIYPIEMLFESLSSGKGMRFFKTTKVPNPIYHIIKTCSLIIVVEKEGFVLRFEKERALCTSFYVTTKIDSISNYSLSAPLLISSIEGNIITHADGTLGILQEYTKEEFFSMLDRLLALQELGR